MSLWIVDGWKDYELLDSGDGEKLEKWGGYTLARPEPRAMWQKENAQNWKEVDGVFEGDNWKFATPPSDDWSVSYGNIKFKLRATDFKHTGVFPEQAVNWLWLSQQCSRLKTQDSIKVLNLFAYTGGATMAAALSGAHVTHVDSSRPAMMWASENCKLSGVAKEQVRWMQDDALKFVQREIRRGVKYDAIVMDPPRFGRGASGEVWKLEDSLPKIVHECRKILSESPIFFLINAYTADLSHLAIEYVLTDAVQGLYGKIESGEIGIRESSSRGRVLPAGIFARWSK